MPIEFILTNAGKAAIVAANNTGTNPVTINRVGVGSASWTPTAAATALQTEIKKITAIGGAAVANDTIHVTASDTSSDVYTVREIGLFLTDGTLLAVYSQSAAIITKGAETVALIAADLVITGLPAGSVTVGDVTFNYPQATETVKGVAEIATTAEAQAGIDDERMLTPLKLQTVTATTTRRGVVELATDAEVQVGADTTRVITPAGLAQRIASETLRGLVELATDAEVQSGTDTTRAVTPAGLASRTATTTRTGVVELATSTETQDGTDLTRAITPQGLASRTATEARTGLVELATDAEVQAGTDTTRAVTPAGLASRTATETRAGIVELANASETLTGTDTQRAVTPAGLAAGYVKKTGDSMTGALSAPSFNGPLAGNAATATALATSRTFTLSGDVSGSASFNGTASPTINTTVVLASTAVAGKVELATTTETQDGTDTLRAVTPAGLASLTASATRRGLVELATTAETTDGQDAERAVTPNALRLSPGHARAWVVFNGQGTVAIINSHNVASITDRGVGRYTVNFSTPMGSSNYCWTGSSRGENDTGDSSKVSPRLSDPKTVNGLGITTEEGADPRDSPEVCVVIHT